MKRWLIFIAVLAVLMVLITSPAFAKDPDGREQGVKGAHLFYAWQGQVYLYNAGQLMQYVKEVKGLPPGQFVKQGAPNADTVGEYLYVRSHNSYTLP